jgi:hypothetical protein
MECRSCVADLDHCHGTLIMHVDGTADCTDFDCRDTDAVRHALRITCVEIDGGCACVVVAEELAQAS